MFVINVRLVSWDTFRTRGKRVQPSYFWEKNLVLRHTIQRVKPLLKCSLMFWFHLSVNANCAKFKCPWLDNICKDQWIIVCLLMPFKIVDIMCVMSLCHMVSIKIIHKQWTDSWKSDQLRFMRMQKPLLLVRKWNSL